MPVAYRESLGQWIRIAAERVVRGQPIYCHEASTCDDDKPIEDQRVVSASYKQLLDSIETTATLRIHRTTVSSWAFELEGGSLPADFTFTDLPAAFRTFFEQELEVDGSAKLKYKRQGRGIEARIAK